MTDCEHKETYLSSLTGSLWGPGFARFCKACGVCTTDDDVEARPEEAADVRRFDEAVERAVADGPVEISEEELEERRKALEEQLRPFRRGLTHWG